MRTAAALLHETQPAASAAAAPASGESATAADGHHRTVEQAVRGGR